jgi:hypothetical protein
MGRLTNRPERHPGKGVLEQYRPKLRPMSNIILNDQHVALKK